MLTATMSRGQSHLGGGDHERVVARDQRQAADDHQGDDRQQPSPLQDGPVGRRDLASATISTPRRLHRSARTPEGASRKGTTAA